MIVYTNILGGLPSSILIHDIILKYNFTYVTKSQDPYYLPAVGPQAIDITTPTQQPITWLYLDTPPPSLHAVNKVINTALADIQNTNLMKLSYCNVICLYQLWIIIRNRI